MNRVFKNINIFRAQKSIFRRTDSKNWTYSTGIYEIFANNYLKTLKFYETYKCRENFGEFCYLVKKFTVVEEGIISVGTLGPLKDYQAPPAGGPGAKAPRTVAKFHFFKRCNVLENESSFQKFKQFSCPKNLFFRRNNSKNWTYLTGISEFFSIIIRKLANFMKPINAEKISVNSLIWLRNLQWRRKELFRWERSGHLKTIKHPPQGVLGRRPPGR